MTSIGKRCTGCRACEQICPQNAIQMQEDSMGFLAPKVDENKCVSCVLCERVCHLTSHKGLLLRKANLAVFAAKNKNEQERLNSSSGGIFSLLAKSVIESNGTVYGAAFDSDFVVKHKRITQISEIPDLMGSKYVQSDTCNTFVQAAQDLSNGKIVLYSGVPCQIAAVQQFMSIKKVETRKLIALELVCHGCPSPMIWRSYIDDARKIFCQTIYKASFRSKTDGWHAQSRVRLFGLYSDQSDSKPQEKLFTDISYMRLFLKNLTLHDECHICNYARRERVADITLCDFWGIENSPHKDMDDDKGVSGVVIHSEKGLELWKAIQPKCNFQTAEYETIAQNQQAMNVPFRRPEDKDTFWNDFHAFGWKGIKKYIDENTEKKMMGNSTRNEKNGLLIRIVRQLFQKTTEKDKGYMELLNDMRERLIHIEDKVNGMKDYLIAMRSIDNAPPPRQVYSTNSFAQHGEDAVIMNLFTKTLRIEKPTYIDIGAHHPYEISNTALFYQKGCWGINIEANPNLFEAFEKERPHSINLCCGVGGKELDGKSLPFYMIDECSGRNSFDKMLVENFIHDNPKFSIKETKQIPIKSLDTIFMECNIDRCPDYMSIDIEGMEYQTLKGFDLKNNGPKILTVEVNGYTKESALIKDLLLDAGYFLYLKICHNYTFIKNEYKDMVYA